MPVRSEGSTSGSSCGISSFGGGDVGEEVEGVFTVRRSVRGEMGEDDTDEDGGWGAGLWWWWSEVAVVEAVSRMFPSDAIFCTLLAVLVLDVLAGTTPRWGGERCCALAPILTTLLPPATGLDVAACAGDPAPAIAWAFFDLVATVGGRGGSGGGDIALTLLAALLTTPPTVLLLPALVSTCSSAAGVFAFRSLSVILPNPSATPSAVEATLCLFAAVALLVAC